MSLADLGDATGEPADAPAGRARLRGGLAARRRPRGGHRRSPGHALRHRPANHVLIGVHLEHPGMRLVATDLPATCSTSGRPGPDVDDLDPDTVIAQVEAYLDHVARALPARRTVGVGVASPGYIDPATGSVIAIGRVPTWSNLPICGSARRGHRPAVSRSATTSTRWRRPSSATRSTPAPTPTSASARASSSACSCTAALRGPVRQRRPRALAPARRERRAGGRRATAHRARPGGRLPARAPTRCGPGRGGEVRGRPTPGRALPRRARARRRPGDARARALVDR
jgi:hypothetical protein